jgi:hypothetical protein
VKLIQKLRESWLTHQEIDELEEYVKQLEIDANRYKWLNKYTSQLFMVTEEQTDQQVDIAMGKNMTEDEAWDELERKQTKKWNSSDMAYRPNGLTVDANIINKAKWYQEGYEAGQRDERELCAKLCEAYIAPSIGKEIAAAIRGRTEPKSDFKTQMDDNWSGII